MIDLVVAKVQRQKLVVSEKQFSNHHSATSLNFVQVQVQELQVGALLERLSQVLSTLTLNFVSLEVEA